MELVKRTKLNKKLGKRFSVKNPRKMQGFLEVHQKLTKNVVLSSKFRRTEIIIQELKSRKISLYWYDKVVKSKYQPRITLSQETFCKRRRKKRTYQRKLNVNNFQKINKNTNKWNRSTSTCETEQTNETHQDEIYLNNETDIDLSEENKDRNTPRYTRIKSGNFLEGRRKREPYENK